MLSESICHSIFEWYISVFKDEERTCATCQKSSTNFEESRSAHQVRKKWISCTKCTVFEIHSYVSKFKNELKEDKSCYNLIDVKVKDQSLILLKIRELL